MRNFIPRKRDRDKIVDLVIATELTPNYQYKWLRALRVNTEVFLFRLRYGCKCSAANHLHGHFAKHKHQPTIWCNMPNYVSMEAL